jgi:hypothetical protein
MPEPKTKASDLPVSDFLDALPDPQVRKDCWAIVDIMQAAAQAPARMWGPAIVGFGQYDLVDARGKAAPWMLVGFSPRKQAITLYLKLAGLEQSEELLARLGKYTRGKGCLYLKRLADVDLPTLAKLVRVSVAYVRRANLTVGGEITSF